jgi:capsular exopolysaccharide synthesis family protein
LLVEADLRHPALAARYGLSSRNGLTSVLTGDVDRGAAVTSIPVGASANGAQPDHSMDVVLGGALPPNPTDLIESPRMADFIRQAEREYDFVVVDTPPVAIVSDAIPLLTIVGGVIVVSRLGQTTRDAVGHLRSQLDNLEAPVLGVVVNSVDSGRGYYGYRYGYGYGGLPGGSPNGASAGRPARAPAPLADRPSSRPQAPSGTREPPPLP